MKVTIFIDGQNFFKSLQRNAPGARVDYVRMVNWITYHVSGYPIHAQGCYYYTAVNDGTPNAVISFLKGLENQRGFFVRMGALATRQARCRSCGKESIYETEKSVDVQLTLDMYRLAQVRATDAIVLLSGDEDFLHVIEAVNALGIQTWLATWGGELSSRLRASAYGNIDLKQGLEEFKMKDNSNE